MEVILKSKSANENSEMRSFALETMKKLRAKEVTLSEAKVVAQLCGSILLSLKLETDYIREMSSPHKIEFFETNHIRVDKQEY